MSDLRELPLTPPEEKQIYKDFPVTLTLELDVQVEARDEEEAKKLAYDWLSAKYVNDSAINDYEVLKTELTNY
ncbi:hypothetical protein [Oribacterium sinus]|uniref:hypothetical protein n=1 Tax=Oribacterium sinus TaxID=237576 RepID=UPI0028F000D4|nr:hypothetical protein [Oribacterium sinus]